MNIPENNRRFAVIETGVIVAIVDSCRTWTRYAPINGDNTVDLSATRTYWADELREL